MLNMTLFEVRFWAEYDSIQRRLLHINKSQMLILKICNIDNAYEMHANGFMLVWGHTKRRVCEDAQRQ